MPSEIIVDAMDNILNDNTTENLTSTISPGQPTSLIPSPETDYLTSEQASRLSESKEGEVDGSLGEYVTKLKQRYPSRPPLCNHERIQSIIKKDPADISAGDRPVVKLPWILSTLFFASDRTKK